MKPPEQVIEEAIEAFRKESNGCLLSMAEQQAMERIAKEKAQELPQIKPKLDWYETEEMEWEAKLPFGGRYFVDKDHTMWQLIDASAQTIVASGMGSIEEAEKDFEGRALRLFGSGELPGPDKDKQKELEQTELALRQVREELEACQEAHTKLEEKLYRMQPVSNPSDLIVEVDGEQVEWNDILLEGGEVIVTYWDKDGDLLTDQSKDPTVHIRLLHPQGGVVLDNKME